MGVESRGCRRKQGRQGERNNKAIPAGLSVTSPGHVSLSATHTLSLPCLVSDQKCLLLFLLYIMLLHIFFCFYHLNSDDNSLWGDSQIPCVIRSRFDNQPIIKIFEMTSKKICTILKICALPTHLQQSSICYRYELCLPKYVFFLFFSLCLIFL